MVASRADHPKVSRKASHGTPGLKYLREVQSSTRRGDWKRPFMVAAAILPASRKPPQIQPTMTTTNRTTPDQRNQMLRPASHHDIAMAVAKRPRSERKGTV